MNDEQQRFIEKARASLNARSQQLSPALEGRLRAVRRTAMASTRRTSSRLWLPAMAGMMLVAVVVGVSWFSRPMPDEGMTLARLDANGAADDFELLTRDAPLELYQDLEFYYWLELEGEHAG